MKRSLFLFAACLLVFGLSAKKVKFAVDMSTHTISTLGIHVMGDFQTVAGFAGGDFNPASTQLIQEGSSTIYSIILNIPAFQKYEYKFVNGDQSYEAEFVPEQSRVGYNFNDNRWIYVDSLANDTTFVGAIIFGANAPAGKTLIRFVVDMQNESGINSNGVHVAGDFQGFDPSTIRLYSFGNNIYEIITYMSTIGSKQFKYYNGNSSGTTETVPGTCATSGNRTTNVVSDSILVTVCYSSCNACIPSALKELNTNDHTLRSYPNPANSLVNFETPEKGLIIITDISGKQIMQIQTDEVLTTTNVAHLPNGFYQVYYKTNSFTKYHKLIIEN